jgi:hypothetical protein
MAFSCPEFPGLSFSSLEELEALRQARDKLKKKLTEPVKVTAQREK